MTIRKATPAEINAAFESARASYKRALTFEEVQVLDAELAREIERDDKPPPKHTPHGNYRRADYFETQCKILEVDLAVCMEARRTLLIATDEDRVTIRRLQELGLSQAAKLTTAEMFTIPNLQAELKAAHAALQHEGLRADRLTAELEIERERKLPDPATCQHDFTGRCNNIDGSEQIFCRKCGINPPKEKS